ncbi:MAG: hypothetical protein ACT4NY_08910 [Pseudonocardiales bacterium]
MGRVLALLKINLAWVKTNAESMVTLILAVSIGILGLVDVVPQDLVTKTIPLTLAVVVFAMLRDRSRQEAASAEIHKTAADVAGTLKLLHDRVDRIAPTEDLLKSTQRALDGLAAVRVAVGNDVSKALAEARTGTDTDRWVFKGGTGTHTRVVTLPECLKESHRARRELRVRMEIIDPTDLDLCSRYARLYRNLAEGDDDDARTWTGEGTQIESYATVLAVCWYKQKFAHLLDIKVGLSSTVSTFRWDLSSRYLIVTQRGPRFPAMIVESGMPYYDCWNTELLTSFGECRNVPIERALEISLDQPSTDEVRQLFRSLSLDLPTDYKDADIEAIIEKAMRDTNPFVRGAGDNLALRQRTY